MSTDQDIKNFMKEIDVEVEKNRKKGRDAVLFAYTEVVLGSPVDQGYFVNNHLITVNKTINSTNEHPANGGSKESKRNDALGLFVPVINKLQFKDNDTIFIQNNLDYASELEANGGIEMPAGNYRRAKVKTEDFIKGLK